MVLEAGELRSALACASCMKRGIVLTTPPLVPTLTKATLDDDERDIRVVLRKLARHFRGLSKAQLDEEASDAMNTAADVADAWAARPEVRR